MRVVFQKFWLLIFNNVKSAVGVIAVYLQIVFSFSLFFRSLLFFSATLMVTVDFIIFMELAIYSETVNSCLVLLTSYNIANSPFCNFPSYAWYLSASLSCILLLCVSTLQVISLDLYFILSNLFLAILYHLFKLFIVIFIHS